MKKFLVLLPIILTGCSSDPEKTQCEPEKNYIISNPELIEKYKEAFKNGEVKSVYYDTSNTGYQADTICNNSTCIQYDNKKFEYIEKKINDSLRKGIYTIYNHEKNDSRCNFWTHSWDKICYESVKNNNNEIKSRYGLFMYEDKNATVAEFKDLVTNKLLYRYSKTIYVNNAIGGPGFGFCSIKSNNNPDYNFNYSNFDTNPLNSPYNFENDK